MHITREIFLDIFLIKYQIKFANIMRTFNVDKYNTTTALFYSISKSVIEYFCKIKFTIKYLYYCAHANPCNATLRII